ncbi:TIGR01777 family oxidoreductase [Hymenobacter weizhouensis]|uniref:TIGR01777 family oxidoreductase n=1 Tax=Hymenobacter sp. YIM 151500-1 TaxID=2987689 RepID=UPI002225C1B0|nr:TIGR01777 family oxidoreductase [Hymenobacter sp. YIM 151500-1]UYZ63191.1 TIGR01777 family oxidoreductase [Hymenobacter sp. YIM 151500-1]
MSRKVLITGGTGMIGSRLADMLIDAGYEVAILSRKPEAVGRYRSFRWDLRAGTLDEAAIKYADYIINLAGSSVSEGKWTEERKREILDSRIGATTLLARELAKGGHHVRAFLSASAIGIYGDQDDRILTEQVPPAPDDFLATVCQQWEAAAQTVEQQGIRTVIFRIGIVLSPEGGALVPLARTVKLMAGAPLGSGRQYMSWIHLDDLCRLLMQALEEPQWQGIYNAVAPHPVTNKEFTETLAEVLHRPLVLPKVPEFGLKLVMGEMSEIVLASQRVSADKVLRQGFTFEYPHLKAALESFYAER